MRGCDRPLKLTEFIAHPGFRGILISSCDLETDAFAELLRLMKNVSAAALEFMAHSITLVASDQRRQIQHYSAVQASRALATFARGRLGVAPLKQQKISSAPFFFSVNASLGVEWLGQGTFQALGAGAEQHAHPVEVAAPMQTAATANKVESLRKALQLRQSASNKQISLPPQSPLQPTPVSITPFPAPSASLLPQPASPGPHALPLMQLTTPLRDDPAPPAEPRPAKPQLNNGTANNQPPRALLTSARWMGDAEAPRCCDCNAAFTLFNRRHHCRVCGRVLDGRCCSKFCVDVMAPGFTGHGQHARVTELVCFPCQNDIGRGLTPEQAAANRSLPSRFGHDARALDLQDLRSHHQEKLLSDAPPVALQAMLRSAAPVSERHELEANNLVQGHHSAAGVFGAASRDRAKQWCRFQDDAPERAANSVEQKFANAEARERDDHGLFDRNVRTDHRRALSAASSLHAPPAMRFRDLQEHDVTTAPQLETPSRATAARSLQAATGFSVSIRRSRGVRLPSRVSAPGRGTSNGTPSSPLVRDEDEARAPQEAFAAAYDMLDRIVDTLRDADRAHDVADEISFDAFMEWADVSLELPPEVAATAAAAAYRQSQAVHKAALRSVGNPHVQNIPRSLFPMLVLNFKIELQKQDMRLHAAASTAARPRMDDLPSRLEGGRVGSTPPRAQDAPFHEIGEKIQECRAQGTGQVGAAANEIEAILRNSGLPLDDCYKTAMALVSAGTNDLRSMVQLLRQDDMTLSRAGLLPSHKLRVLRNMAKQPAFAAEAPSFRLTLSDD
jgi:hypothetical protein